jgi:uncharacterized C2H2 Zn-finger protein
MNENDDRKIHKCGFCKYKTNRKYDLNKHHNRMHKYEININADKNFYEKNVVPNEKNVVPNEKNVVPNEKNVVSILICKKCNKIYKTKKSFIEHEKNCKGIDELTCPRCMISFKSRYSKSKHIKRNNCKPRSIIYARTPNPNNIDKIEKNIQNNIEQQTNNIETQNNIQTQNNIYINNYGSERLDYLNYEKMLEIFKKSYNIPTLLTKEIHFNENFPENNNIRYENEKSVLIKKNDGFIYKNLTVLARELINNKSELMKKFAEENKDDICLKMGIELYELIIENLIDLLLLHKPDENYIKQVENIRDLIKNTKMDKSI